MAPEDTDPAPGGPWPPRGARDPGHHATVTTDPQQDTLPHAHDNIPPCPARLDPRGLSSSPGAEAPSPGDDPSQEPLEAREGTTPNSDEAGFSPEGADRGHRAPSAVQASQGQDGGGEVSGDRGRVPSGRRPTSACGAVPGGRAHQRRHEPGRQVNVHGIPPPPARERSRDARGRRPASAPLARLLPPANRAPHRWGPPPRDPRRRGPF